MGSLERRAFISAESAELAPPLMQLNAYPVRYLRVFRTWLGLFIMGCSFFVGNMWDWVRRKKNSTRSAVRLRQLIEKRGFSYQIIGRKMAMRIDFLPWDYCLELSQISDQAPPVPIDQALRVVEEALPSSIPEVFSQFDPDPIATSLLACTYQARLETGEKVAVKVQRPGIGTILFSDLKALDWVLAALEFLSIIRPGGTKNFRSQLHTSLQYELNFLLEARNQALFRVEARKTGANFFTAPKIHFQYCSDQVIVRTFTTGMWLRELLDAVETHDPEALARAAELNISPKKVARRLLWVNFWEIDEHLLFRADLHPDNLIIKKNSRLAIIDFSSTGALTQEKRRAVQQTMRNAYHRDPLEMARESMILLEPLPPIDVTNFTKDLEAAYWQFLYALESKHIDWWERTSARLWLGFVDTVREHQITMDIDVLRMIRSSLLHDTLAARLSPKIDRVDEYQRFTRYRAAAARKRLQNRIQTQFQQGIENRFYLQFEEITHTSSRLLRQLQRYLGAPVLKFNAVLGKSVYSLWVFFRWLGQFALLVLIGLGLSFLFTPGDFNVRFALSQLFREPIFLFMAVFLIFINVRTLLFRLGDKEVNR